MRRYISYEEYLARHPVSVVTPAPPDPPPRPRPIPDYTDETGEPPFDPQPEPVEVVVDVKQQKPRKERRARTRDESRGVGCFGTAVLALCFCLAVTCAVLLSKGLGLAHLRGDVTRVTFGAKTAWCVQIASPSAPEEAAAVSRETRAKGGGGYIVRSDGVYLVLASAYASEKACDSVIEKLSFSDVTAAKYALTIPAVTLDFAAGSEAVDAVRDGYGALWEIYETLYAQSEQLDLGDTTAPAAKLAVAELSERIGALGEALGTAAQTCGDPTAVRVCSELAVVRSVLDGVCLDLENDATLSADLKYAYLKILWATAALAAELGG